MQLTPAQKQIARDKHRFRVVNCGRRFGKTILATEEMIALGLHREARIAYVAPTFQQARDIAWEQLKKRLRDVEPAAFNSALINSSGISCNEGIEYFLPNFLPAAPKDDSSI